MRSMERASETPAGVAFGRFRVLPHRRELLADGLPIKLGGRAFDVLMALIEARGAVVSKNALMARVWPDQIVEENNLQWRISTLRAAFGADRNLIRTVSGRGYQFTAEIEAVHGSPEADAGTAIAAASPDPSEARSDGGIPGELPRTNLPESVSELIGRDTDLEEIRSLSAAHRLVTLTGPGGIGKTRLALAAGRRLLPQFADGVWLAEFSPIADPGLVPVTVAAAIGLDLSGGVTAQRVSQALAGRRLALVLDMIAAILAGGLATHQIPTDPEREIGVSQIFVALNPAALGTRAAAIEMADRIVASAGGRYPGQRALELRAENLALGVPVEEAVWREVTKTD